MAALILGALCVLLYAALMVSMLAFGGIETPAVGMLVGLLFILAGTAAGALGVFAIFKRRERSVLVFLALAPAALTTFLLLGEILYIIVLVLTGTAIH
jgi:hypothetical protein